MCAYPKIKDKVEPDGNNLLLESISCKRDALVKVLVNNLIYINSGQGTVLGTPIHFALKKLFTVTKLIGKLLANGVNPNSMDAEGKTCLHTAFCYFRKDKHVFE